MPDSLHKMPVEEFLRMAGSLPVVDVRSPGEYEYGHIPGAINIPLFDNQQRAIVGTIYKQDGHDKAVKTGIDLAAPEMSLKLQKAQEMASDNKLLVHCWRGGMRSEAMAWLFSMGGIKTFLLDGGYKAYRNYILEEIARERKYLLLGGLTGSGKTQILKHIAETGFQFTDLEALACHKGSAFGAMGQPPQPSSEHFTNLLFTDLTAKDIRKLIWLEDESRNIGTVFMPDDFYAQMQQAPVIALMMSIETRLPRLLEEYTAFPKDLITASIIKISKRLGGDRVREALQAVESNDFSTAIRITLEYYDKAYNFGLSKRKSGQVIFIESDTDNIATNARKVIEAASSLR